MPSSDPDFTRFCANGDEPAFRALVAAHLSMVLGVAVRKLGPHAHLAQDVAQSVFTRLARAARGLPHDLVVAPWLHRQTVRLAIDAVRKEERRRRRETTAAMLHTPDSRLPAEVAPLLDEALNALPAADRSVLVLHYLEDRDYESVAATLGTTPEAARKRASRSLEKLRALLGRHRVSLTVASLAALLGEQSARAASPALTARISASAVKAAATGKIAAVLTAAIISNAAAIAVGAFGALLVCGGLYWQREKEIAEQGARNSSSAGIGSLKSPQGLSDRPPSTTRAAHTLEEIIAAIVSITEGPETTQASESINALLRQVTPAQYADFYIAAEARVRPSRWRGVLSSSVTQWKDVDPASLTVAIFDSDAQKKGLTPECGQSNGSPLNSVFSRGQEVIISLSAPVQCWKAKDMPAALRWLESMRSVPLMGIWTAGNQSLHSYLSEVVPQSFLESEAPFSMPAELPPDHHAAWLEAWSTHLVWGDRERLLESMRVATPQQCTSVARRWSLEDPGACREWILSQGPSASGFAAALGMVAQQEYRDKSGGTPRLSETETLERAALALSSSDSRSISATLAEIVDAWCTGSRQVPANEDAMRSWLAETGGDDSSSAFRRGAQHFVTSRPAIALSWAAAIPDAAQRAPLLRGIFVRWQDREPGEAQRFLTTAPADIAAELQPLISETP